MKRNLFIIVMSILAFSLVFVSCDNSPKTASYKVTVKAGSDYSVSNTVEQGGSVKLPAASALTVPEGQYFAWFSDGINRYAAEEEVTNISSDLTITAVFKKIYTVGAKGEAGGWIVYDVDADNADGNDDGATSLELGWRYLECAPEYATVTEGETKISTIYFGYLAKAVEGSTKLTNKKLVGTGQLLGDGKENTEKLVSRFGEEVYTDEKDSSKKTKNYAAKVADSYTYTNEGKVYDDWHLPSAMEMIKTVTGILTMSEAGTDVSALTSDFECCSSSEVSYDYYFIFASGEGLGAEPRDNASKVIPVRYI